MNADSVRGRRDALWEGLGKEAALRWKGVVKRVPHFAKTVGMATFFWKIEGEGATLHWAGGEFAGKKGRGSSKEEGKDGGHIVLEVTLLLDRLGQRRQGTFCWKGWANWGGAGGHTLLEALCEGPHFLACIATFC